MEIKTKIICIQFIIIGCLVALFFSINQKPQILNPLAGKNIKVLGDKITRMPSFTPTQTLIPTLTPTFTPTPTPTPIPTSTPIPSPSPSLSPIPTLTPTPTVTSLSLDDLFSKYSSQYAVAADLLKKIANCESGFNINSVNGDYLGMFQFSTQTWITNRDNMGLDNNPALRTNAEESIKTAAFMIGRNQTNAWPSCSK